MNTLKYLHLVYQPPTHHYSPHPPLIPPPTHAIPSAHLHQPNQPHPPPTATTTLVPAFAIATASQPNGLHVPIMNHQHHHHQLTHNHHQRHNNNHHHRNHSSPTKCPPNVGMMPPPPTPGGPVSNGSS